MCRILHRIWYLSYTLTLDPTAIVDDMHQEISKVEGLVDGGDFCEHRRVLLELAVQTLVDSFGPYNQYKRCEETYSAMLWLQQD